MHIIICVRWNRERKKRERDLHINLGHQRARKKMAFLGVEKSFPTIDFVCASAWNVNRKERKREHSSGCFSSITGVSFSLRLLFWIVPSATRGRRCTWWVGSFSSQNNKLCHLFLHLLILIQSWYIFLGIWNAVEQEEEEEEEKQKGVRATTPLCLCGNVTAI